MEFNTALITSRMCCDLTVTGKLSEYNFNLTKLKIYCSQFPSKRTVQEIAKLNITWWNNQVFSGAEVQQIGIISRHLSEISDKHSNSEALLGLTSRIMWFCYPILIIISTVIIQPFQFRCMMINGLPAHIKVLVCLQILHTENDRLIPIPSVLWLQSRQQPRGFE